MPHKCWPTNEFNMATVKTGSTYIFTYRHYRDFVPNLNHMPTTSPCHRNFHLHSNPRWQSSMPEILISTLSVTMETPFQSWIIYPHPRNYHEILTDDRIQYGDRQNRKYLPLTITIETSFQIQIIWPRLHNVAEIFTSTLAVIQTGNLHLTQRNFVRHSHLTNCSFYIVTVDREPTTSDTAPAAKRRATSPHCDAKRTKRDAGNYPILLLHIVILKHGT